MSTSNSEYLEFDLSNNFYMQEKDYHYIIKSFDIIGIINNDVREDHKNAQTKIWHRCYVILSKIFDFLKEDINLNTKYFKVVMHNNMIKIYKSLENINENTLIYFKEINSKNAKYI